MARYEHLKVYRITVEIQCLMDQANRHLPRDIRYTTGQRVLFRLEGILEHIIDANNSRDLGVRIRYQERLRRDLSVLDTVLRGLALDRKVLPKKTYAAIAEALGSLSANAEQWLKSTRQRLNQIESEKI